MKFDLNKYQGKYVMHCKTEEEAKDFLKVLHANSRNWSAGNSYLEDTYWKDYETNTCYNFNSGTYCDLDYSQQNNYIILKWSDFMSKIFTKQDLCDGDFVVHRCGDVGIVNVRVQGLAYNDGEWSCLASFNDDLSFQFLDGQNERDIVKVYRPPRRRFVLL